MKSSNEKIEWVNATEARQLLDVARATFARLVKEGILKHESNPLNKKEKLFDKAEVLALRDKYKRR